MSLSAAHTAQFYREAAEAGAVWTIRDDGGFPAPVAASGERAQPFWSSKSRAERIIKTAPAYRGFTPYKVDWQDFASRWVPGLTKDGILVGVNWSGAKATGYDLPPLQVQTNVEALMRR